MPRGDRTGPAGFGPMTGRAAGYCAGYSVPGYMNPAPGGMGRAWGRGMGYGHGWRNWHYATGMTGWQRAAAGMPAWGAVPYQGIPPVAPVGNPATADQEMEALKNQARYFEGALEEIRKRINEMEDKEKKD